MIPEEQLSILKQVFSDITMPLYDNSLMMKLTIASSREPEWFEKKLNIIDVLCMLFDESIMLKNPRRAITYLCFISKEVAELRLYAEDATSEFEHRKLLI